MPLEGLPSTLEVMLTTLLQENAVTSFKVESNTSRTVVVLRFTSGTGQQHGGATTTHQSSASFKKKTASQIARDRERAEAFQLQNQQQRHQQQPQQQPSKRQASPTEIPQQSLSASCLFSPKDTPVGLRNSDVVNTPLRSPSVARANRELPRDSQLKPPAIAIHEETHVAQRVATNTQQESVSTHRVVSGACGGGGDDNSDDLDIDEQAAASLKNAMSQLLEECSRLSQQHQQMNQQQQRQHQEIVNMQATGRPPPPSRYHLRSGPRM